MFTINKLFFFLSVQAFFNKNKVEGHFLIKGF